jgi:PTH1 family peptidyl-tRNA hydrolase
MLPTIVVFGLGNPGARYARTRHNLGWRVVDRLAADHGAGRWRDARSFEFAEIEIEQSPVALVKPRTYVNLSGRAALELRDERGIPPEQLLVAVDDIALPLGQIRLRLKGSDGGHNGLKSVIAGLGTMDFPRMRLGLGAVPPGVDPADFVLSRFRRGELRTVESMIERAARCVETIVGTGFEHAMGLFNAAESPGESR